MTHMSFQELMTGEYTSAIVQYAHTKRAAKRYINYFLSSKENTVDRDRLGQSWWLHVWFHTCEMLNESSFAEWCTVLAEDERCHLKLGSWTWYKRLVLEASPSRKPWAESCKGWLALWVGDIDCATGSLKLEKKKGCFVKASHVRDLCETRMPLSSCWWYAEGVASLLRNATIHHHTEFIDQVVQKKVHYSIVSERADSPVYLGLRSKAWRSLSVYFSERGYEMSCGTFAILSTSIWDVFPTLTTRNFGAKVLSTPCRRDHYHTQGHAVVDKLREGLILDDDVDKNFVDPMTKVTLLMEAAAVGNERIVDSLCKAGVDINATSSEGCTALHYAADLSPGTDGLKCLRRLLSAGASVQAGAGLSYKKHFMNMLLMGAQNTAGQTCAHNNEDEQLSMLIDAGHDIRSRNTACRDSLFYASLAADTAALTTLLERKASVTEGCPRWNKKDPFCDVSSYEMDVTDSIHMQWDVRVLGTSASNANMKVSRYLIDYKCDLHATGFIIVKPLTCKLKLPMHAYSAGLFKDCDTSLFETIVEKKAEVNYKLIGWPFNFYFCHCVEPACPLTEFAALLDMKVDFNCASPIVGCSHIDSMRKKGHMDKIELYDAWVKEHEEQKSLS